MMIYQAAGAAAFILLAVAMTLAAYLFGYFVATKKASIKFTEILLSKELLTRSQMERQHRGVPPPPPPRTRSKPKLHVFKNDGPQK